MRVLITSANTRMAYVIAKSLVKKKVDVVLADYMPGALSSYSRYVHEYFQYPSPYAQQEDFIDYLVTKAVELNCDVLLPVHEETFLIAKYIHKFDGKVKLAIPGYEQILSVHNKDRFVSLCESIDVAVPKTRILKSSSEAKDIVGELRFPVILKPRQGGGNFGIEHVKEPDNFPERYVQCLQTYKLTPERLLVQEFIEVDQKFSQSFIYDKGQMIASFADIHLRDYPATGGSGTLRQSIHRPDLEKTGKKIMDTLWWHGVAECEFVTEKNSDTPYIIEINPRVWGGINSAISAGLNVPWILCCIATGQNNSMGSVSYRDSVETRWFWGDVQVFPYYFKKSSNKLKFVYDFCKIISSTSHCDDFDLFDPMPFFVWPTNKLFQVLKNRSFKTPSTGISGEWD